MNKNVRKYNIVCTYGALFLGILVGCFVLLLSLVLECNILGDKGLEEYNISTIMNISTNEMLFYVLKKRVIQIFIYFLMILILPYGTSSFLACSSFGFYYGLMVANLIIKYSFWGLLYGLACFFPHYLIYFVAIYLIGKWRSTSLNVYYQNMKLVEFLVKIFVIIFMIIVSLAWEINFQKIFLNYFFQHLV